ncbi:flagellin [Sphingobium boeckii]|uniref:Flagellin n=1 Tax=Sphingobium boeckii TaxID=1082345 RepID=A0A7W9EEQ9_9SPHN|nr:flagellin [Sphingobium boeckii]MBB5685265.1 flagellin [Sphingobium boeckii]
MALSVNTNVGAMMALQTLGGTNRSLETTQNRINTGLNVASTKDDSAKYTIAQQLRGDLGGLSAVTSSLNNAKSATDVAVSGVEQISDIINKMKTKALEASDVGVDAAARAKIDKDYVAYQAQVENIVISSNFNGVNLLNTGGGSVSALMSLQDGTDTDSTTWEAATLVVANQALDALTVIGGATLTDAATSLTALAELEADTITVGTALSDLGSASRRIDDQIIFTSKLSDSITSGIGNLVDADLAKESANLQSLQVKQQLGVQALSIANQAPQTLLSLFR